MGKYQYIMLLRLQVAHVNTDYRQFAIEDITGGIDYAAMRQALTRRYKKAMLPDLLLIDGGKELFSLIAMEVMQRAWFRCIMVGVSKGEGRKPGLEASHLPTARRFN